MYLILLWALVGLIGRVHCKCGLAQIADDERPIAYVCIHGDLSDLEEISSDAEWIEFSVTRLHRLPNGAFARFANLRRLAFYNCHIGTIDDDAFRGLNRLDWLVFHATRLHVARATWFENLRSLRRLIMDRCGLIHVEPHVFQLLPRVETLGLRDNDLDCLPIDELATMSSLRNVRIDGNPWLCACRQRLELYFESRSIVQDEEECRKGVGVYRNMQCMTPILVPILPPTLSAHDLQHFEKTRPHGNEFQTSVFTSLDRLPDKTTWIEISGLRMNALPRYGFFRFGNSLRSLELRDCSIMSIEPEAFAGLHKLERLSLISNSIATVNGDLFRDLVALQQLILLSNGIRQIDKTAFWHVADTLRHLDIRDNRLTCLPVDSLLQLRKLERLDAAGNPWTCSCRASLERFLLDRNIGFDIGADKCYNHVNDIPGYGDVHHHRQNVTGTHPGSVHWGSFRETITQTNVTVYKIRPTYRPPVTTTEAITQRPQIPVQEHGICVADRNDRSRQVYTCSGLESIEALRRIPNTADTVRITLSHIREIPPDAFRRFDGYLRRLELVDCGIEKIHPGAFASLYNLEFLSLQTNDLVSIGSEHVRGLTNLRHLDLSRNQIFRISNGVFDALPYLITLDISENQMNCVGIEYMGKRLQYLRALKVSNNPWSCLCGVKMANYLERRGIQYDHTTLVDRSEECYVIHVPTTTTHTTTVSPTPTTTTSHPTTSTTPRIETITGVCTTHEEENGLRYRCSGGNLLLLKTIPPHVTAIEFYEGNLPRLPSGTFAQYRNLKELVIRNCGLRFIDQGAFDGLDGLETLSIQDNPLMTVEPTWFTFRNLRRLDLRGNSLKYIAPGAFRHLKRLEYLNLEGNDLKCIFTSDINDMPEVYVIEFAGNPLKWRCRVELEQFLESRKIKFVEIDTSCEGKKIMKNLLYANRTADTQESDCPPGCSMASEIQSSIILMTTFLMALTVRWIQ